MHILVTGAAGFIGYHVSKRLAELGHTVVGLDCLRSFYSPSLKEKNIQDLSRQGVTVLRKDLVTDDLSEAVQGVDLVYHLAAQPGISATSSFDSYLRDNLLATHRLLDAVRPSSSLRALINISTSSVYGSDATGDEDTPPRPTSYYGVTKLAAEQLVLAAQRDAGVPACSFRLFSVYGPRERPDKLFPSLIRALLKNERLPLYEGSEHHIRSYTYVRDIVNGLTAPLTNIRPCIGEIFNLGSDQTITTGEAIGVVEELVGAGIQVDRKPRRAGDQLHTHANIAKASTMFGYKPETDIRTGLAETVAWYKQNASST